MKTGTKNLEFYFNIIHQIIVKVRSELTTLNPSLSDLKVVLFGAFSFVVIRKDVKSELMDLSDDEIMHLVNYLVSLGYETKRAIDAVFYLNQKNKPKPIAFASILLGIPIKQVESFVKK
jgi:hypothetical protein